jgi:hypothetical protein
MQSAKVDVVVLSFTESDLELAVAVKVREVEGWHDPMAVDVVIPPVHAHRSKMEKMETFMAVKPPHIRALV